MTVRIVFSLLAFAVLAGCTPIDDVPGYDLTLESEDCRSASVIQDYSPASKQATAGDKQANFDSAYLTCMQAKGYQLTR